MVVTDSYSAATGSSLGGGAGAFFSNHFCASGAHSRQATEWRPIAMPPPVTNVPQNEHFPCAIVSVLTP